MRKAGCLGLQNQREKEQKVCGFFGERREGLCCFSFKSGGGDPSLQILVGSTTMLAIYISLQQTLQIAVLLLKISDALFSFKRM